jgi:putative ABC transport system ATP-binding protein
MPDIALQTLALRREYRVGREIIAALGGVDLSIQEGEFVAVMGPSGCGKSTLLNLLGGLDQPSAGKVLLDGHDLSEYTEEQLASLRREKMGFIFQRHDLFPVLTARENVEYVMLLQGMDPKIRREKSMAILKAVGLEGLAERKTFQMSGGQGQRVAVARAVVAEPQLILADEPTANLDSKTGELLIELMEYFNRSNHITFIIASHDLMVINRARRIIQLKDGRILEDRTVQ